ncbi:MAG: flagellar basal body L-ring protein FlgH [Deltaproteobacteria bacterium]|jgi:flagellar L-ring protein precursor FlgH|nr:flagellar basal body L-ring protein FlgH [Deltaproteobacteria bacterium]
MKHNTHILGIFLLLGLAGCATSSPPEAMLKPTVREIPVVQAPPAEGSLFIPNQESSLYGDFRARNVGDVVTILIQENLKGSKDVSTKTSRNSDMNVGLTGVAGLEFVEQVQPGYPGSTINPSTAIGGGTKDTFDGSGKTSRNSSLTGTISARVVQVLPDGNLVVEGTRELKINNETQYLILSGVVRPKDLSPDNTIPSTRIADARMEYTGGGVLSEKQSPGWLARILGSVSPF